MELQTSNGVITNAVSSNFKISENAGKIFYMLSTALYQNRENAVLYELSTNAYDEHILSGQPDKPFEIVFPTTLDSNLRVRDFGRGLSEADVYRLLCTYGESDKSHTNDAVGGFGIGFKSCASVSDNWTVKSYHQSMMSEYLIFVSATGIPSITKIRSEETSETGLEIAIPAKSSRFSQWEAEIRKLYTHFPVKPVIKNLSVNITNVDFPSRGWTFFKTTYAKLIVVSSYREYTVDSDKLKNEIPKHLISLLEMPIYMKIGIGELDMSISRETLQYSKKTITAIVNKLQSIYDKYLDDVKSIEAVDGFDYREKLIALIKSMNLSDYQTKNLFIHYMKLHARFGVAIIPRDLSEFTFSHPKTNKTRVINKTGRSAYLKNNFNTWRSYALVYDADNESLTLRIGTPIKIFIADCHGAFSRVMEYATKNVEYVIYSQENTFPKELQKYVAKASTLPKATRVKTAKEKIQSELFKLSGKVAFKRVVETPDYSKSAFVELTHALKGEHKDECQNGLLSTLNGAGYTIYGIKGALSKQMMTPTQLATKIVKKFPIDSIEQYYTNELHTKLTNDLTQRFYKATKFRTVKDSLWNKLADAIDNHVIKKTTYVSVDLYFRLCNLTKTPMHVPKVGNELSSLLETVYNKYYMFRAISSYDLQYNTETQKLVKQYITEIS